VSRRGRTLIAALGAVLALAVAVPGAASAHAYLVKTSPAASTVLKGPPPSVQLTYDEAVEPRFAIVSVTNAKGVQETTTSTVTRSPANPDTLIVSIKPHLARGWYLVYWRAISVDGHPVQGAFTFAVGPDAGPAPQFQVPSIAGSATSLNELTARWAMFLLVMGSIGLFAFRMIVARPMRSRMRETSLRAVSRAFVICSALGLIAIPVYLDISLSIDSLRSSLDVGTLVGLFRTTAFSRGYTDMMLCFALFCLASWISLWVDRSDRPQRSVVELVSVTGAVLAAAATLALPGISGHAAQTSPRGISVALDWVHLISGSLWLGGLAGLIVLWATLPPGRRVSALAIVVPRFSNVAFGSVAVLLGSGIWATINHLPTLDALWLTGYGVVILVKIGLLLGAMALAAVNLLRTKPAIAAAGGPGSSPPPAPGTRSKPTLPALGGGAPGEPAARLLLRLISGETVIVAAAVFAAAILSSLAPPPPAFAETNHAMASVSGAQVAKTLRRNGYTLALLVSPNRATQPDAFSLKITRGGQPVAGATVTLTFNQTEMSMPEQEYGLAQTAPGVYTRKVPAFVMTGTWSLNYRITPKGAAPFSVLILDKPNG
jgi:copper transport protein